MSSVTRRWFGPRWQLVLAAVMALVFSACSPQANTALVGKWQETGRPNISEFRADGTFGLHLGEPFTGKYKSVDAEHIKLTFDGVAGKVVGESKWKAVVRGDILELTDPDGHKSEFQRVK